MTTPALLFPALSLLLLAYTNRFLALAALIRNLHADYKKNPDSTTREQIETLRHRVVLIRNMQALGVSSLFLCVLCMFLLFAGMIAAGKWIFALSLLCMLASLGISNMEILVSVRAINLQLGDLADLHANNEH